MFDSFEDDQLELGDAVTFALGDENHHEPGHEDLQPAIRLELMADTWGAGR